jgi:hypothetical protein
VNSEFWPLETDLIDLDVSGFILAEAVFIQNRCIFIMITGEESPGGSCAIAGNDVSMIYKA